MDKGSLIGVLVLQSVTLAAFCMAAIGLVVIGPASILSWVLMALAVMTQVLIRLRPSVPSTHLADRIRDGRATSPIYNAVSHGVQKSILNIVFLVCMLLAGIICGAWLSYTYPLIICGVAGMITAHFVFLISVVVSTYSKSNVD